MNKMNKRTYLERFEDMSFMLMKESDPKGRPLKVIPLESLKPVSQLLAKVRNTLEVMADGHVLPRKATLARKAIDEMDAWLNEGREEEP